MANTIETKFHATVCTEFTQAMGRMHAPKSADVRALGRKAGATLIDLINAGKIPGARVAVVLTPVYEHVARNTQHATAYAEGCHEVINAKAKPGTRFS